MRSWTAAVCAAMSLVGLSGVAAAPAGAAPAGFVYAEQCRTTYDGQPVDLGCDLGVAVPSGAQAVTGSPTPTGYGARDLEQAFALPADDTDGQARTIAIIAAGSSPTLENDLATYRAQYGLPACTTSSGCLRIVGKDGGAAPKPDVTAGYVTSAEETVNLETSLDVQMASAACPGCRLLVVEFAFDPARLLLATNGFPVLTAQSFATAVTTAKTLGANAISMSYSYPNGNQAGQLRSGAIPDALHLRGTAVVASSGDAAYRGTSEYWPSELPFVTDVGGVDVHLSSSGFTYNAWGGTYGGSSFGGAGSGCILTQPPAVGQPTSVSSLCGGHRAYADVSAAASQIAVYDSWFPYSHSTPGWFEVSGTSASAPFIAGLYARGGRDDVEGPNTMYAAPAGTITDVTSGSNSATGAAGCAAFGAALCVSGPGWDGPTGVGVPHGVGAFRG